MKEVDSFCDGGGIDDGVEVVVVVVTVGIGGIE